MSNFTSISTTDLRQRRKELKNQRRLRFLQGVWQIGFLSLLMGGLCWAITRPNWVINQKSQVNIEGNQYLQTSAIMELLSLSYPQNLWELEPQELITRLESKGPIEEVRVTRQMLPPTITIEVKEREPVALAVKMTGNAKKKGETIGYLDAQGVWTPKSSYFEGKKGLNFPALKIFGDPEQYGLYWSEFYQNLSRSTIKISEVDWQNPNRLILKTEIGRVVIGPYTSQFLEQVSILGKLKSLPAHINPAEVAYIDLTNPKFPAVQMVLKPKGETNPKKLGAEISRLP